MRSVLSDGLLLAGAGQLVLAIYLLLGLAAALLLAGLLSLVAGIALDLAVGQRSGRRS